MVSGSNYRTQSSLEQGDLIVAVTRTQIQELVEEALRWVEDDRVVGHIQSLLVEPVAIPRAWDYGAPEQMYPCWAVMNHASSNTGIAYCAEGFGPERPWGLVHLTGTSHMSIGQDCGWFEAFSKAYFESMAASDLPIWRVLVRKEKSGSGEFISKESDWDSTWERDMQLRKDDPDRHYFCDHCIQYSSPDS